MYYLLLYNTWTLVTNKNGYCFLEIVEERHHEGEKSCSFLVFKQQLNVSFSTGVYFTQVTNTVFVYIKHGLITKKAYFLIDP